MKESRDSLALRVLVKRNIKIYMKDKLTVFFSVLAPIIVLLLYVLFLGKLQTDTVLSMLGDYGLEGSLTEKDVSMIINNWMVGGLMGVSCITVAINTNIVMIRDKMHGNINDIFTSPVKKWVVYMSYILSCFLITLIICLIVLFLSIIYLACVGACVLTFVDFLALLGITMISTISSAFFMVLICGFLKTTSALTAFNSLLSTAVGFLVGAYLPFSMLPNAMKYIASFIPGTYSVGLFKQYFLNGCIKYVNTLPDSEKILGLISDNFSLNLEFFGASVSTGWMTLVILASIAFFAILMVIFYSNKRTNVFAMHKKIKKHKAKQ